MKEYNHTLTIRSIQHFQYCKRRWGLLEINQDWLSNASVSKANLMHERVHNNQSNYISKNKIVKNSMAIYIDNEEFDIQGELDSIEFIKDVNAEYIKNLQGNYCVTIIEYKPTAPKVKEKINEADKMQLFIQKLCVDWLFECNANTSIYFGNTKRRYNVNFEYEKYYTKLKNIINEIYYYLDNQIIPQKERGQKCSGCSMKNLCFPNDKNISIKNQIYSSLEVK